MKFILGAEPNLFVLYIQGSSQSPVNTENNIEFEILYQCTKFIKISTCLAYHGVRYYCTNKNVTDVEISICPALKTICQGDKTNGISVPCILTVAVLPYNLPVFGLGPWS